MASQFENCADLSLFHSLLEVLLKLVQLHSWNFYPISARAPNFGTFPCSLGWAVSLFALMTSQAFPSQYCPHWFDWSRFERVSSLTRLESHELRKKPQELPTEWKIQLQQSRTTDSLCWTLKLTNLPVLYIGKLLIDLWADCQSLKCRSRWSSGLARQSRCGSLDFCLEESRIQCFLDKCNHFRACCKDSTESDRWAKLHLQHPLLDGNGYNLNRRIASFRIC